MGHDGVEGGSVGKVERKPDIAHRIKSRDPLEHHSGVGGKPYNDESVDIRATGAAEGNAQ